MAIIDAVDINDVKVKRQRQKRVYYEANRDKMLAQQKAYREANPDKRQAYHEANRDKKRVYYEANRDKIKARNKARYDANQDKIKAYRKANKDRDKAYRVANRNKINARHHRKYKTDIQYKLRILLRSRLFFALKGERKSGSAVKDLGCSIPELRTYLEFKFQSGMTWDNQGEWHIDHIKPLASFDLTDRKQLLLACHYTNLQPLWAIDNLSKGDKIISV